MVGSANPALIEAAQTARDAKQEEKRQRRLAADSVVDLLLERAQARRLLRQAAVSLRATCGRDCLDARQIDDWLEETK